MEYDHTVVILKPDCLERELHFPILRRIEERCGLGLDELAMTDLEGEDVDFLYPHQAGQPFYKDMREYLTGGPVIVVVFVGEGAVSKVRDEVGHYDKAVDGYTKGRLAIRSAYADPKSPNYVNLIHASATDEEAASEAEWFFPDEEE